MKRLLPLSLILAGVLFVPMAAFGQDEPHATPTLLANVSAIKPGEPFLLGIRFKIDPEWHIYWMNPGDSGLATDVKLNLPTGFTAGPLQFPVPKRLQLPGDVINYAYEDEVLLMVQVTPPKDLADKSVSISGKSSWLVCKDNCVPGKSPISLDLTVADAAVPDNVDLFKTWQGRLPLKSSDEISSMQFEYKKGDAAAGDTAMITVNWDSTAAGDLQYLPDVAKGVDISDIKVTSNGKSSVITFAAKGATDDESLPGLLTFTNKAGDHVGVQLELKANAAHPKVIG